ncbi:MAG: AIR synthase related protein, partial [Burkholderiales bacterium]|nr:AIR synthase related protein [Burkholderiales bacterium]
MAEEPPSLDEFSIIKKFFTFSDLSKSPWFTQGIGDDCAFLDIGNIRLAITTDMEALGTHFLDDADPYYVGRKTLAVNLSDLAAAGATPRAFLMSIGLPKADVQWLKRFSKGLSDMAKEYN